MEVDDKMKLVMKRFGLLAIAFAVVIAFTPMFSGGVANAKAKIKLNTQKVYMAKGDTYTLKVKGVKAKKVKKIKWKSSNKKIVKVTKKGKLKAKLTGKNIGKATIIAKVKLKNKKKYKKLKCKVIVEKKSINKARKLRSYVLKHYNKKKGNDYILYWENNDGSNNFSDPSVIAHKGKNTLEFCYFADEESGWSTDLMMSIDLISGKASLKTGTFIIEHDEDVDDPFNEETVYGKITTAYDGKGNGLTLTKKTWTSENEEGNEVVNESEAEDVLADSKASTINRFNEAFSMWDEMFSKKYPAMKKAGISMKSIGFSKWSK